MFLEMMVLHITSMLQNLLTSVLKMAKETGTEDKIPEKYRWDGLAEKMDLR